MRERWLHQQSTFRRNKRLVSLALMLFSEKNKKKTHKKQKADNMQWKRQHLQEKMVSLLTSTLDLYFRAQNVRRNKNQFCSSLHFIWHLFFKMLSSYKWVTFTDFFLQVSRIHYSLHIVDCYTHIGYYTHNVLTAVFSLPFVVFCNLPGILNLTLYLNHGVDWSCSSHDTFGISHIQLRSAFFIASENETREWTHCLKVVDLLVYLTWCPNTLSHVSRVQL